MNLIKNQKLLTKTIKESQTKKEVLIKLGYTTLSGNYTTLNRYIKKYNIDESHLKNIKGFKKNHKYNKKWEFEDIFKLNSKAVISNYKKKKILLKKGLIKEKCSLCNQEKNWFGKNLSFILDHINGNNKDDRIENLRLICPNCDSTLSTYMGRNNSNPNSKKSKDNRKRIEKKFKKQQKIQLWKDKIIEANIDFSKKTWGVEVSKLMDKSPQYCLKFVKENLKEYLNGY